MNMKANCAFEHPFTITITLAFVFTFILPFIFIIVIIIITGKPFPDAVGTHSHSLAGHPLRGGVREREIADLDYNLIFRVEN